MPTRRREVSTDESYSRSTSRLRRESSHIASDGHIRRAPDKRRNSSRVVLKPRPRAAVLLPAAGKSREKSRSCTRSASRWQAGSRSQSARQAGRRSQSAPSSESLSVSREATPEPRRRGRRRRVAVKSGDRAHGRGAAEDRTAGRRRRHSDESDSDAEDNSSAVAQEAKGSNRGEGQKRASRRTEVQNDRSDSHTEESPAKGVRVVAKAKQSDPKGVLRRRKRRVKVVRDAAKLKEMIRSVYERHDPSKVDGLDALLAKYVGAEDEVYRLLCEKYGEEPKQIELRIGAANGNLPNPTQTEHAEELGSGFCAPVPAQPSRVAPAPKGFARKASAPPPPPPSNFKVFGLKKPRSSANKADALAFFKAEIDMPAAVPPRLASEHGDGWPFMDDFSGNSSTDSEYDFPFSADGARDVGLRDLYRDDARDVGIRESYRRGAHDVGVPHQDRHGVGLRDLYGDLEPAKKPTSTAAPVSIYADLEPPTSTATPVSNAESQRAGQHHASGRMYIENFLGKWRDSLGHDVMVAWAKLTTVRGQLDVELSRPNSVRPPIRLNVRDQGGGKFQCGHYELDTASSTSDRVTWLDNRTRGKTSVWVRVGVSAPQVRQGG